MALSFFTIKKERSENEIRESIRRAYDPVHQNCCEIAELSDEEPLPGFPSDLEPSGRAGVLYQTSAVAFTPWIPFTR